MKFQRLISSKLLSCVPTRYFLTILLAALGVATFPSTGRADFLFEFGVCNPSDGCNQSVNFTPANTGTTVIGDTNPPKPLYDVFASNGLLGVTPITLHGSGSTVDNALGGGFTSITLTPQTPFAWGTIEFQLDSLIGSQPTGTLGLFLTATDQFGHSFTSPSLPFPWEGNNGENQQYHVHGINGEDIIALTISYTDPLNGGNTIQDIHNIDVETTERAPEPSSLFLLGIALLTAGRFIPRKH